MDASGTGTIELKLIRRLIRLFEVSDQTAEAIVIEMARDGSDRIDLQRLIDYLPQGLLLTQGPMPAAIAPLIPLGPQRSRDDGRGMKTRAVHRSSRERRLCRCRSAGSV